MFYLIAVWLGLVVALLVFAVGTRREGGALTVAYFFGLSLIHVPGAVLYIDAASESVDRDVTRLGFEMTIIGMGAFVMGAMMARILDRRRFVRDRFVPDPGRTFAHMGWRILAIGVGSYFVLLPISSLVPSVTSIVAALATTLILGLWLVLYGAVLDGNWRRLLLAIGLLPVLPLATLINGGFIGYGVYWILSIVAFLFVIVKDRTWFYLAAVPVAFLGLSLFVSYMGQRNGIRDVVWYEQASLVDRLDRISRIVTQFEVLNLDDPDQIEAINDRLNQNLLVGIATERHEAGVSDLAYGATVPWWVLIPRVIWPNKPVVGGSGNVVSDFTGIHFEAGTSVGIGQVLEFYINFGSLGVVFGFLAYGFVLTWLDAGIARALAAGDGRGLLVRAMPGLTLLQPGGSLLEITVACVAAMVAARAVLYLGVFRLPVMVRKDRLPA